MVDAIVSPLLDQLVSMAFEEAKEQVRLVTGVGKEVKKLTSNLRGVQAVLNDAEKRQVKEETVRVWLDKLKDASYDMEDVLDEWNTARLKLQIEGVDEENALVPQKKVCSCFPVFSYASVSNILTLITLVHQKKVCSCFPAASCFGFKRVVLRRDIAFKIKEINETLDDIAKQKDMFGFVDNVIKGDDIPADRRVPSISSLDESEIFGRQNEKNQLLNHLLCESSEERKGLHVISLVGMGGIGKTTLAQLAYNNQEVKKHFEKRIWVCVSEPFDEFRVAKAIFESLEGSGTNLGELNSLMQHFEKCIAGKKFLLVLDDVWNEDYTKWEPFYHCLKNGLHGSKILITTRKKIVAQKMRSIHTIFVNELSENDCWSVFEKLALMGRSTEKYEKLEKIGRKIVGKCKGLPLAAKTIGSLLSTKDTEEEWKNILESEMWELEEVEKLGLLAPLLLSYNDLPSMVKRCFLYCVVFPKDFQIYKGEIISLWMAQGYLRVKTNKEMEIIGEEYFNTLVSRSFFQDFHRDDDGEIVWCKMHDIIHDTGRFLCRDECFAIEMRGDEAQFIDSFGEKVRHSMLVLGQIRALFPAAICTVKKLRSLLIIGELCDFASVREVLHEIFDELTCLRVLDLRSVSFFNENYIREIPTNIGKLVHLRYLNLSGQSMEELPETLCELYNLQRLNVIDCSKLKELPQGIGKLINMRCLFNDSTDSLKYMPVGMGRLTSLRNVSKFYVGGGGGGKMCSLESLKNLNLLRVCGIYGLGEVSDVGEASRSELDKKKNLVYLELNFHDFFEMSQRINDEHDEQLLEALQPPPNLKELQIHGYKGYYVFPKHWMISLTNLRVLVLYEYVNCEHLPPLGKLSSLEKLDIYSLNRVKRVGNEFLGIESDDDVIAFPKLKTLRLDFMDELEEWDYGNIAIKGEIMPRLSSLEIYRCDKLKALPDQLFQTTTLQDLKIIGCTFLTQRYDEEDWHKISHIPNIEFDFIFVKGGPR